MADEDSSKGRGCRIAGTVFGVIFLSLLVVAILAPNDFSFSPVVKGAAGTAFVAALVCRWIGKKPKDPGK